MLPVEHRPRARLRCLVQHRHSEHRQLIPSERDIRQDKFKTASLSASVADSILLLLQSISVVYSVAVIIIRQCAFLPSQTKISDQVTCRSILARTCSYCFCFTECQTKPVERWTARGDSIKLACRVHFSHRYKDLQYAMPRNGLCPLPLFMTFSTLAFCIVRTCPTVGPCNKSVSHRRRTHLTVLPQASVTLHSPSSPPTSADSSRATGATSARG